MLIQLSDILLQDGKQEEIQAPFERTAISSMQGKCPVQDATKVQLTITNLGDSKLEILADVRLTVLIPCDRCLEEVPMTFDLHIERKLDMKQTQEDRIKDLDESNFITQTELDVDQLVCNEVLIEWPLKILCREDCKGICSQCGTNLNQGECSCNHEERLDPRMAAISDIFSKFKEV